jgi:hypothetical protein
MNNEIKRVLITGATSGIGLEFAGKFHKMGYSPILVGRNAEKLKEVSSMLSSDKPVEVINTDLSDKNSAELVYKECKDRNLEIDILVNNAGFGLHGEHVDLPLTELENMMELNIVTLVKLCHLFGKDMKNSRKGYILNVASTASFQPLPYMAVYGATKSFVLNFSEALSKEMEDYNVYVTCLCPGATESNFFVVTGVGDESNGMFARKNRMTADEVAEIGIKALFSKRMTIVAGWKNYFLAFTTRFVSRNMAAGISKYLMKSP